MKNFKPNQILCEDSNNLDKLLPSNSVHLSIVVPPHRHLHSYSKLKSLLEKINQITKPGGTCCFFIEDEIDPKSDFMSINATKSILEILDSESNWILDDKIIWIKNSRRKTQETSMMNSGTLISFEDTPFATIYILVKKGSNFESIDFREKAQILPISHVEKEEIMDDFWYIHPVSEKGFSDRIPKELASRLIMLFSKENELVLDPFSGYGITAIESKTQQRHFLCIDKDESKVKESKKRSTPY